MKKAPYYPVLLFEEFAHVYIQGNTPYFANKTKGIDTVTRTGPGQYEVTLKPPLSFRYVQGNLYTGLLQLTSCGVRITIDGCLNSNSVTVRTWRATVPTDSEFFLTVRRT